MNKTSVGRMTLTFKVLTWDEIISMSIKLGNIVKKSGYNPNYLIGVARGGLVPLRIISDFFNNNNVFIVNVKLYEDIARKAENVRFLQGIDEDISGHNVLVIDDVADTGVTLKAVVDYIRDNLKPKELKVATLHYKPWSVIKPDYYLSEVKDWIVYPWEYVETIRSLTKKLESGEFSGEEKENAERALKEIQEQLNKYDGVIY